MNLAIPCQTSVRRGGEMAHFSVRRGAVGSQLVERTNVLIAHTEKIHGLIKTQTPFQGD